MQFVQSLRTRLWYINATCRASLSIYLSSCCLYSLIFSLLNLCLSMHSMFGYPEHVFCSYYMHREFVLLPLMALEFEGAMNLRHSPRLGKTFNLGNLQLITVCMYIYTLICAVSPGKGINSGDTNNSLSKAFYSDLKSLSCPAEAA